MKLETADILDLRIPSDDGAIARALANLETKLADWTAYVEELQAKLIHRSATLTETNRTLDQNAKPAVTEAATREGIEDPIPSTDTPVSEIETDPISSGELETVSPEPDSVTKADARLRSADVETTDALGQQIDPSNEPVSTPQAPDAEQTEQTDDEALLQSLPPHIANDIRVQYRFCNGRKSLRELIATYEAKPKNEKNSWWKRTKG
ncbi:MAG: hypothetical protein MI923_11535 [Phycisphaerales bacterium]|nr:hypothetical protein [Phycisphaerales bacterium]